MLCVCLSVSLSAVRPSASHLCVCVSVCLSPVLACSLTHAPVRPANRFGRAKLSRPKKRPRQPRPLPRFLRSSAPEGPLLPQTAFEGNPRPRSTLPPVPRGARARQAGATRQRTSARTRATASLPWKAGTRRDTEDGHSVSESPSSESPSSDSALPWKAGTRRDTEDGHLGTRRRALVVHGRTGTRDDRLPAVEDECPASGRRALAAIPRAESSVPGEISSLLLVDIEESIYIYIVYIYTRRDTEGRALSPW